MEVNWSVFRLVGGVVVWFFGEWLFGFLFVVVFGVVCTASCGAACSCLHSVFGLFLFVFWLWLVMV